MSKPRPPKLKRVVLHSITVWDFPFDESLLDLAPLIIHCPSESLAYELLKILERNGIRWDGCEEPTSHLRWYRFGKETCYFVKKKRLSHGSKGYAERNPEGRYDDYLKCSFTDLKRHPVTCFNVCSMLTEWTCLFGGGAVHE